MKTFIPAQPGWAVLQSISEEQDDGSMLDVADAHPVIGWLIEDESAHPIVATYGVLRRTGGWTYLILRSPEGTFIVQDEVWQTYKDAKINADSREASRLRRAAK